MEKQVTDRLIHYIAEAYGDHDQEKLNKLRHDIECGVNDATDFYKKKAKDLQSKVISWNETRLKMNEVYGDNPPSEVNRIKKWMDDSKDGVGIRSQHGYRW